jgi:hypothetical protein
VDKAGLAAGARVKMNLRKNISGETIEFRVLNHSNPGVKFSNPRIALADPRNAGSGMPGRAIRLPVRYTYTKVRIH